MGRPTRNSKRVDAPGVRDLAGALDGLPGMTGEAPERQRLRATGTDNAHGEAPIGLHLKPRHHPRHLGRETVRKDATSRDGGAGGCIPFRVARLNNYT